MHGDQHEKTTYVCGFALGPQYDRRMGTHDVPYFAAVPVVRPVLLLRKAKPTWQAGKLNGVGGKIELGEGIRSAMAREFFEETLIATDATEWTTFHTERWRSGVTVHFLFHGGLTLERMRHAVKECQGLSEPLHIRWLAPEGQIMPDRLSPELIENLWYLLPMAQMLFTLKPTDRPLES